MKRNRGELSSERLLPVARRCQLKERRDSRNIWEHSDPLSDALNLQTYGS